MTDPEQPLNFPGGIQEIDRLEKAALLRDIPPLFLYAVALFLANKLNVPDPLEVLIGVSVSADSLRRARRLLLIMGNADLYKEEIRSTSEKRIAKERNNAIEGNQIKEE